MPLALGLEKNGKKKKKQQRAFGGKITILNTFLYMSEMN